MPVFCGLGYEDMLLSMEFSGFDAASTLLFSDSLFRIYPWPEKILILEARLKSHCFKSVRTDGL